MTWSSWQQPFSLPAVSYTSAINSVVKLAQGYGIEQIQGLAQDLLEKYILLLRTLKRKLMSHSCNYWYTSNLLNVFYKISCELSSGLWVGNGLQR